MIEEILKELKKFSPEEIKILEGDMKFKKDIYTSTGQMIFEAKKLLDAGKLISIRPHTRFIEFPEHTHNYVEVVYMCSGSTHHVINGNDVILKKGELLFLNQNARQKIYAASEGDLAINFIILPEFFDHAIKMMDTGENMIRNFIIDCLRGDKIFADYLHFKVAEILPIQNLVENLIWTLMNQQPNTRGINQITMGLLFLQLMNHVDKLQTHSEDQDKKFTMMVLSFIEEHYKDGGLSMLAEKLHYDVSWISKEIKKQTGSTYTELVQMKRLNQAAYLLTHTKMSVMDIGLAIGYDNTSYFHRIFQNRFGTTPRRYRKNFS